MKFLLDENVHHDLFLFLRRIGHDVKASPRGERDRTIFMLALQEERIFITRDADFCKPAYLFRPHYGIILIRIEPWDVQMQEKILLELLKQFPSPRQLRGKVMTLIPNRWVVR